MIDLITLQQAKRQIHRTDYIEDEDIADKVTIVSAIIMNYLKRPDVPEEWIVSTSSPVTYDIPADIQGATLLGFAELYRNREASVVDILSPAVRALLERHRDPALA